MTTRIKLRRDTASNWTNADPILALAEPGIETDTNKMKVGDGTSTWSNLQYIDGADVTRKKVGWVQSIGYIPDIANGEGDDFWFESVTVDADNNSYYTGSNYINDTPWTVKLDANGEIVWQTQLGTFDGYEGAGEAIQIDPTNGEVVVVADMWSTGSGGDAGMLLYRLNPSDGSLIGNPLRLRDDQSPNTVDIYPYDLKLDSNGNAIIFGGRNDDKFDQEVTKQTGSNGQKIIIATSILETGAYPKAYDNWYMTGTDITGEGYVIGINDYTNVTGSTGGSGGSATFSFSFYVWKGQTYKTVNNNNTGNSYQVNDTITISATDCGASSNVTITVTEVGGGGEIVAFNNNYTPDLTKVMLTIDPNGGSVDFANSGTWNLIQYKGDSAFIYSEQNSGWTAISGNSDNDFFYVGGIDSNSNVYGGGYTYDSDYYGGWDRNMLCKYDSNGTLLYAKSFDLTGSEGSNGYTGLAIDSNDNVYLAGEVYDFDDTNDWYYTITKVNSAGVMVWQKGLVENGPFDMWNMCLAVDSDDNVYLAAEYSSIDSQDDDFYFVKFDSNGNTVWQRMLSSYGDADSEWNNGYQSLVVKGDRLFYCASTETYSTNYNSSALAVSLMTDGSGVGKIGNGSWEIKEINWHNWTDTPNQQTGDTLSISNAPAVFTTDEPVTGSDATEYTNAFLNVYSGIGGEVGAVKQLTFEDGTVQTTASKPIIPQVVEGTLHGSNDFYLRLEHAGQFVRVNFYNNDQRIYVPMNSDVPFEVGTVITIIADDTPDNGYYIEVRPSNGRNYPEIVGSGFSSSNWPYWWDLNRNSNQYKTGIYTLMKVDTDRWIVSGPDIAENWD